MPAKRKAPANSKTRYKTVKARKRGLAGGPGKHGASRDPNTGLLLKLPGHDTVNLSVSEDRRLGYRTGVKGRGLSSYRKSDPRGRTGARSAPRDRDISGAIYESDTKRAIKAGKAPRTAKRRSAKKKTTKKKTRKKK